MPRLCLAEFYDTFTGGVGSLGERFVPAAALEHNILLVDGIHWRSVCLENKKPPRREA